MESPVSGFSHLQLHVGDLARSEQFYSTALGLKRMAGSPEVGYIAMSGAGGRFAVVLSPGGGGDDRDPLIPLDHLAFAVPSLQQLTDWALALTAAGIEHDGLVVSGEGTSVHIVDPDGLNIELIAAKGR